MVTDVDLSLWDIQYYILKNEDEKIDFLFELAKKYSSTYVSVRYKIIKTLEGSI
jgi:hypothetical protein